MNLLERRKQHLEATGRWLDRQSAYRYRYAGEHEIDAYLWAVAIGTSKRVGAALGFRVEAVPVVEARPGDSGIIWEDSRPLYGFCMPLGSEVYINFSRCATPRRVVECIAHEAWHLGHDAPHRPGEDPSRHECSLYAASVANQFGY